MNKHICRLVLIAILVLGGTEQSAAQWHGHIKIGVTGSTLRGDADSDFSPIVRFSGGAAFSYEFRNGFYLQPEFLYTVKGGSTESVIEIDGVSEGVPVDATFDLTYLEIPLLLVYRFDRPGIRPRIFAGPTYSYKLDAQVTWRSPEGGPSFTDEDTSVSGSDFGFTIGAGFDMDVGSEILELGLRTSIGLSNARSVKPELNNTSLALYAGMSF